MNNEQLTRRRGFTLIELLVGIAVFAILISAIIGILVSGVRTQRQTLSQQDALNQLSYAIEYISRALRMVKRDETGWCCITAGYNYYSSSDSSIQFINHLQSDTCQRFFWDGVNKRLKYHNGTEELYLTGPNLTIENLKFQLLGESETDNLQPRVTIFIEARPRGFSSTIKLQTTISQRNLDVP